MEISIKWVFMEIIYYDDELINYWLHTCLLPMIDKVDYEEI